MRAGEEGSGSTRMVLRTTGVLAWPGADGIVGKTADDVDVTAIFFQRCENFREGEVATGVDGCQLGHRRAVRKIETAQARHRLGGGLREGGGRRNHGVEQG